MEHIFFILPVIVLILIGEFVNGWNDAANAIATVVSTRVLSPRAAIIMASFFNLLGVLIFGTAVAFTVGTKIVRPEAINQLTIVAAMIGLISWGVLATYWGLPISLSHALFAGLAGAGLATAGPSVLLWSGWKLILIGLLFSTFLGFGLSFLIMVVLYRISTKALPGTMTAVFGRLQLLSSAFVAFSHGSNDGQKFIGVMTLSLVLGGVLPEFKIPLWVIFICASCMALGTAIGGWRVIKTVGIKLTKLTTVHGFAAETGTAAAIGLASVFGIPLSTTHTISTSIMGVGATRKLRAVKWGIGREIVMAWLFTFPVCGFTAWLVCKIAILLNF